MFKGKRGFFGLVGLLGIALGLFLGCSGSTDGGSADEESLVGDEFVASDDATGSITLLLSNDTVEVSEVANFSVQVRDANGNPVPQIKVSCDSEVGVAIVEPTTGTELTDSSGNMSGVFGCALPGSFQMGCRLPIGASKRKFATVHCTGAVPTGFDGFEGSAGGGLGTGGVDVNDDGSVGGSDEGEGLRITSVSLRDTGDLSEDGDSSTTAVDVGRETCDNGTPSDATDDFCEPFFDTHLVITVQNDSNSNVTFTRFTYSLDNSDGTGTPFNSRGISPTESREIPAGGGEGSLIVLFLNATGTGGSGCSSGGCASGKLFTGSSTPISCGLGFRNVTVNLEGATSEGDPVTVTGRTALSFGSFDNCGS